MRKAKRVVAALLVCAMFVMILGGCTTKEPSSGGAQSSTSEGGKREPRSGDKYTIGISMTSIIIPFYVTIRDRVQELCDEKGYELVVLDAQGDSNKQISDMEDLVTQGCDVILCNSYDTSILRETINRIRDEDGIPVIAIDNALDDDVRVLTCVQANNYQNGFECGKWVAQQMKGKEIKAALISGQMGTINSLDRRDGMIAGIVEEQLASEGEVKLEIIAQGYCDNWAEDAAVVATEDIVSLNEDFNVLLSEADVMAMAAMNVLENANMLDGVLVAACADGQKEAFKLIKDGKYGCTGTNSPVEIGNLAVENAELWFNGAGWGDFSSFTYTPANCVWSENIDEFYDPDATF